MYAFLFRHIGPATLPSGNHNPCQHNSCQQSSRLQSHRSKDRNGLAITGNWPTALVGKRASRTCWGSGSGIWTALLTICLSTPLLASNNITLCDSRTGETSNSQAAPFYAMCIDPSLKNKEIENLFAVGFLVPPDKKSDKKSGKVTCQLTKKQKDNALAYCQKARPSARLDTDTLMNWDQLTQSFPWIKDFDKTKVRATVVLWSPKGEPHLFQKLVATTDFPQSLAYGFSDNADPGAWSQDNTETSLDTINLTSSELIENLTEVPKALLMARRKRSYSDHTMSASVSNASFSDTASNTSKKEKDGKSVNDEQKIDDSTKKSIEDKETDVNQSDAGGLHELINPTNGPINTNQEKKTPFDNSDSASELPFGEKINPTNINPTNGPINTNQEKKNPFDNSDSASELTFGEDMALARESFRKSATTDQAKPEGSRVLFDIDAQDSLDFNPKESTQRLTSTDDLSSVATPQSRRQSAALPKNTSLDASDEPTVSSANGGRGRSQTTSAKKISSEQIDGLSDRTESIKSLSVDSSQASTAATASDRLKSAGTAMLGALGSIGAQYMLDRITDKGPCDYDSGQTSQDEKARDVSPEYRLCWDIQTREVREIYQIQTYRSNGWQACTAHSDQENVARNRCLNLPGGQSWFSPKGFTNDMVRELAPQLLVPGDGEPEPINQAIAWHVLKDGRILPGFLPQASEEV
jgi:hypothetical protein